MQSPPAITRGCRWRINPGPRDHGLNGLAKTLQTGRDTFQSGFDIGLAHEAVVIVRTQLPQTNPHRHAVHQRL